MVCFIYDGSFEGLFTCFFEAYAQKQTDIHFVCDTEASIPLFTNPQQIETDEEKARRVWKKLYTLCGREGMGQLKKVFLSELPDREACLFSVVQYLLKENKNVLSDYGHPAVLRLSKIVRMVGREKHRMEAFVRFQLSADRIYFSAIEPDFNVLPLILNHFESRYADQIWLIYDLRRNYGLYYNLEITEYVHFSEEEQLGKPKQNILNEKENLYQTLWRDYFRSTNITARKNMKLHLQHVPKRYWKYLTEKKL